MLVIHVGQAFPDILDHCLKTLRALLEVNVNFETSCYGRDCHRFVQQKATTPFEYALCYDRFDGAHFLTDDVGVNIRSIRRICRERGIEAPTSPRERQPGESAERAELLSLFRKASSPWSLRSLSRSTIRHELGMRIKDINTIGLPNRMIDYITFNYDYAS